MILCWSDPSVGAIWVLRICFPSLLPLIVACILNYFGERTDASYQIDNVKVFSLVCGPGQGTKNSITWVKADAFSGPLFAPKPIIASRCHRFQAGSEIHCLRCRRSPINLDLTFVRPSAGFGRSASW